MVEWGTSGAQRRRRTYLCIDDVVLEQEVPGRKHGDDEDTELARALVGLYEELGVAPKAEKVKSLEKRVVAHESHCCCCC